MCGDYIHVRHFSTLEIGLARFALFDVVAPATRQRHDKCRCAQFRSVMRRYRAEPQFFLNQSL